MSCNVKMNWDVFVDFFVGFDEWDDCRIDLVVWFVFFLIVYFFMLGLIGGNGFLYIYLELLIVEFGI